MANYCQGIEECFIYRVSYMLVDQHRSMAAVIEDVNIVGTCVNDIVKQLEKEHKLHEYNFTDEKGVYKHTVIEEVIIMECFEIGHVFGCTEAVAQIIQKITDLDKVDEAEESEAE